MTAHLSSELSRLRARAERAEAQRDAYAAFVRAVANKGCAYGDPECRQDGRHLPRRAWCLPCRAADLLAPPEAAP